MKNCPNCNAQLNDGAVFCTSCGTAVQGDAPQPNQHPNQQPAQSACPDPNAYYAQPAPVVAQTDHTAEFSAEEVAENKLFALLVYALSIVGIIIALIANINNKSNYLNFHIKQSLKIFICNIVVAFITVVLFWTCIVPFAGGIAMTIILVLEVICFIQTCRNKSVEVPIIRGLGFLK